MDTVTTEKRVRVYPNRKPWMTSKVQALLKARNSAYKSGDQDMYSRARADLKKGIRAAKLDYSNKLSDHLSDNNSRKVWEGLKHITNYKANGTNIDNMDISLAEELNHFFARFEKTAVTPTMHTTLPTVSSEHSPHIFSLQQHQVHNVFRAVNQRKAAGPDGIPGRVLKACADQLAPVFTRLFNLSLTHATVPHCLKSSTIVPVPKSTTISSLSDYRPIALTPVVAKCFEKLVLKHIKDCLPPSFDPHQFAYRANRSTEDAISTALHSALHHLENPGTSVRMLFVDYSSAFNTIIPDILIDKLVNLDFPPSTCAWIKNFLTDRSQSVKVGNQQSSTLSLSTGSPQGCVLSPLLYTIYTSDCTPTHPCNIIIKFADDTTLMGLITNDDDTAYRDEVQRLSEWCNYNNLTLNTKKTKEVVLDFRKTRTDPPPLSIKVDYVERVSSFKFLGTHISEDLSWSTNTSALVKKAQQRLYFLRVLRWNRLQTELLVSFYRATIESVLVHAIPVWYAGCTTADKKRLQRVIRTAEKVIGCPLPSLDLIASSRCLSRARAIIKDHLHPNHHLFNILPSGKRLRSIRCKTNRLKNSFFPWAVRTINAN
uniref:Reverse transcriptase domain-containing protein n=1 Tax=Oreochromis niloticus TaxID=8128 RepID=A0A669B3Y2_ORENI